MINLYFKEFGWKNVLVDEETGVNYLNLKNCICPRYNADGSLVVTDKATREMYRRKIQLILEARRNADGREV